MEMDNQQVMVNHNISYSIKKRIFFDFFKETEMDTFINILVGHGNTILLLRETFKLTHIRVKTIRDSLYEHFILNYPIGFKPIPSFQDYLCDDNGNIMNRYTRKILTPILDRYGYLKCRIQTYKLSIFVHRAVMYVNYGVSELTVDHVNGIKKDNNVNNLEYVTASENNKRAYYLGLKDSKGSKNPMSKLSTKDIKYIRNSISTTNELMEKFSVGRTTIRDIITFRSWKHV